VAFTGDHPKCTIESAFQKWTSMCSGSCGGIYRHTVKQTFTEKPAPAMAQIALRKTAEAKEVVSAAAQVIQKNTYMDDICNSVPTRQEI